MERKKKRVKFNLESGAISEQKPMEGQHKQRTTANENGAAEERDPNAGDTSWIQKASWKSLVGETGRFSFSLGSVLGQSDSLVPSSSVNSSVASMEQSFMDVDSSNNLSARIDGPRSFLSLKHPVQSDSHADSIHVKKTSSAFKTHKSGDCLGPLIQQHVGANDARIGLKESAEHENAKRLNGKQVLPRSCQNSVDKGCIFMRSENYEQEWLEAKRAVKEIFKRSRKDALRSIKMFHTRHNA